jgi:hypothetical protein
MGGGFILGTAWGIVVAGIVLAAMSLSLPLPPRPAAPPPVVETAMADTGAETQVPATDSAPETVTDTDGTTGAAQGVPLPAGSEFNRPPPPGAAILPDTDAPVARNTPTRVPEAADGGAEAGPDATPALDPGPPPVPEVAAAPSAPAAPEAPPAAAFDAPVAGDMSDSSDIAGDSGAEAPADTGRLGTDPQPDPQPDADTGSPVAGDSLTLAPGSGSSPRLPQVTPAPAPDPLANPETAPETGDAVTDAVPNALRDNAVPFEAPETGALMAVILIDDPDGGLTPDTLTRFSFPVAFAIDPLVPGAATRAAIYRDAGFELVILGDIFPEGATETDVAQAIEGAIAAVPGAVALLDTPGGRIQGDRAILDATVDTLAVTGHGLVAFPQGLNAAEQTARRADVPAATMFRQLDDEDQRATVITRFLGRAGFAAGEEGTVVVVGRTRPDTVTALFSWALGARSGGVTLAPLSAVLLREADGG